ncbi:hypothetical protein V8B97DRAFT_218180 [Scleroderma yunnanense]
MNYSYGDEEDVEQATTLEEIQYDGRTPLDRTIDRIGMGSYQWRLLSLCGFGECGCLTLPVPHHCHHCVTLLSPSLTRASGL